ncbi:uncharacterized protein YjbI with pentapeptide repeats [Salinibacter ruber]|uniref:pentapeptide repeat-containing protein n=1 Tax=Salinibacter ruber TaxID=146919 RepID=UPI0021672B14|nr:pentapeptide repeat-containing protein [Salinibacter ruber]MCS4044574.1 uncharacterized protein YjbI with pentapeptide repeats [Salinibacter ruber]
MVESLNALDIGPGSDTTSRKGYPPRSGFEKDDIEEIIWRPTQNKLNLILEGHRDWVRSNRTRGQRADLSNADLTDRNLSGEILSDADLSGALLTRADLSGIDLRDSDCSDANFREADLPEALLLGTDLTEANLQGTDLSAVKLRDADMQKARLWNTGLSGAELQNADLRRARLSGADMTEAKLQNADLEGAKGMQIDQVRGANLSMAKLPEEIINFEGPNGGSLSAVKVGTQAAKKLLISVLLACAYAAMAITLKSEVGGGTSEGSESIRLPLIGMGMETVEFYYTAPFLLALLFGYFHLQMQRLWERLAMLPAVFPDGKPMDRKVHPWLVTGLARAHVKLLKEKGYPTFFLLQRSVVILLVWVVVPVTIAYFTWMYPSNLNKWGGLFLHILSVIVVGGSIMAYGRAVSTLEQQEDDSSKFKDQDSYDRRKALKVFKSPYLWISVLLICSIFIWVLKFIY